MQLLIQKLFFLSKTQKFSTNFQTTNPNFPVQNALYADSSLVNAYALNRDDFENVLTGHPEMREHIQQVASARLDAIYNGNGDDARQSVKTALDEAISHYAKKDDWMDSDDEVGDLRETASGESV